jgi:rSAM/selenodomain-associated transferase 2
MISVIIPTWNEAENLGRTLARVREATAPGPFIAGASKIEASSSADYEIIVVDGGSSDATVAIARDHGSETLQSPARQRAAQMNFGAEHARGDIFLFLHADTLLPQRGLALIREAFHDPRVVGGAFRRFFLSDSMALQITCRIAAFRNFAIGWHLGDQGMFVSKTAFQKLGGFKLWDRFEDLDFSRRLGRIGKLKTISEPALTSARRFQRLGPGRTTLRDFAWTMKYLVRGGGNV